MQFVCWWFKCIYWTFVAWGPCISEPKPKPPTKNWEHQRLRRFYCAETRGKIEKRYFFNCSFYFDRYCFQQRLIATQNRRYQRNHYINEYKFWFNDRQLVNDSKNGISYLMSIAQSSLKTLQSSTEEYSVCYFHDIISGEKSEMCIYSSFHISNLLWS